MKNQMLSVRRILLLIAVLLMLTARSANANGVMPVTGCTPGPWAGPGFSPQGALEAMKLQADQQCAPRVAKQVSQATIFHLNNEDVRPFCAMAQFTCD